MGEPRGDLNNSLRPESLRNPELKSDSLFDAAIVFGSGYKSSQEKQKIKEICGGCEENDCKEECNFFDFVVGAARRYPSSISLERTRRGAELVQQKKTKNLILTGGIQFNDEEGRYHQRFRQPVSIISEEAIEEEYPGLSGAIYTDTQSIKTTDNIAEALNIIYSHGLQPRDRQLNLAMVSHGLHMIRICEDLKRFGIDNYHLEAIDYSGATLEEVVESFKNKLVDFEMENGANEPVVHALKEFVLKFSNDLDSELAEENFEKTSILLDELRLLGSNEFIIKKIEGLLNELKGVRDSYRNPGIFFPYMLALQQGPLFAQIPYGYVVDTLELEEEDKSGPEWKFLKWGRDWFDECEKDHRREILNANGIFSFADLIEAFSQRKITAEIYGRLRSKLES